MQLQRWIEPDAVQNGGEECGACDLLVERLRWVDRMVGYVETMRVHL